MKKDLYSYEAEQLKVFELFDFLCHLSKKMNLDICLLHIPNSTDCGLIF